MPVRPLFMLEGPGSTFGSSFFSPGCTPFFAFQRHVPSLGPVHSPFVLFLYPRLPPLFFFPCSASAFSLAVPHSRLKTLVLATVLRAVMCNVFSGKNPYLSFSPPPLTVDQTFPLLKGMFHTVRKQPPCMYRQNPPRIGISPSRFLGVGPLRRDQGL